MRTVMSTKEWLMVLNYQIDYYLASLHDAMQNNDKTEIMACKRELRSITKSRNALLKSLNK